ncbi:hypothetical protein [Burkholderia pseudomallei]|uniref:hypothetical protein n=1 Tax=Burkholderia pseudomallei TaxID=28450 RepID=UPI000A1A0B80|nr:hypothetical protein [Burkholderia pseudomallei]ARL38846.1 hypothetical protein BOC49_21565 [Burkholderia pseudomallei]
MSDYKSVWVVMQDKEFARRYPDKAFYLRVELQSGDVDILDLPDCITPLNGRDLARDRGYEPTHWVTPNGSLNRF